MNKIDSFRVDHQKLDKGVYISKIRGDMVTLDFRIKKPYVDTVLTDVQMHSLEHLLATALRSGNFCENVIYVGPMGCATGFYIIFESLNEEDMLEALFNAFRDIALFKSMPGNSVVECGNYHTLDFSIGCELAKECLSIINNKDKFDEYP